MAALHYVAHHCRHVGLVLKTDDDIFINVYKFHDYVMEKHLPSQDLLLCSVLHGLPVIRDPYGLYKIWYVSKEEYADDMYPNICSGPSYIMTPDVCVALFNASLHTRFFWVDDVYITGILTAAINLKQQQYPQGYLLSFDKCKDSIQNDPHYKVRCMFSHPHDLDRVKVLWYHMLKRSDF
jgi:beta-1,3-galactosyltransferase 1